MTTSGETIINQVEGYVTSICIILCTLAAAHAIKTMCFPDLTMESLWSNSPKPATVKVPEQAYTGGKHEKEFVTKPAAAAVSTETLALDILKHLRGREARMKAKVMDVVDPEGEVWRVHSAVSFVPKECRDALRAAAASNQALDRCVGAVVGMAVADAIGAPLEFIPVADGTGVPDPTQRFFLAKVGTREKWYAGEFNKFHLQPGQWTDDASMGFCLADSLLALGVSFDSTIVDLLPLIVINMMQDIRRVGCEVPIPHLVDARLLQCVPLRDPPKDLRRTGWQHRAVHLQLQG